MKAKLLYLLLVVLITAPEINGNDQLESQKNVILVLDNSGSMKQNDPDFLIRNVVNNFVNQLDTSTYLGIYLFDDEAHQIVLLTQLNSQENRQQCIKSLDYINYSGAYTNIPAVMEKAVYELKQTEDEAVTQSIIFITDGYIDTGNETKDSENRKWLIESLAADAEKNNIKIFGIAFTEDADYQLIQALTTQTSGEYFRVYEAGEIENAFQKIIEGMEPVLTVEDPAPEPVAPEIDEGKIEIGSILTIGGIALLIAILILVILLRRNSSKAGTSKSAGAPESNSFIPQGKLLDLDQITEEDEIILTEKVTTIGRHTENTICLDKADNTVSGLSHAQIIFQDNSFHLKDLSTNYTKLNDQKLEKKQLYELKNDDIISIMKYRFKFSLPDYLGQTEISDGSTVIEESDNNSDSVIEAPSEDETSNSVIEASQIAPSSLEDSDPEKEKKKKKEKEEAEEEEETLVKPDACPNHSDREPSDVCEKCLKPFCEECLISTNDQTICKDCAETTES